VRVPVILETKFPEAHALEGAKRVLPWYQPVRTEKFKFRKLDVKVINLKLVYLAKANRTKIKPRNDKMDPKTKASVEL
jgi:hypothetical protein